MQKQHLKNLFFSILFLNFFLVSAQTQDFKHFIIYGQSLGIGHQSYPGLSLENVPGNYMMGTEILVNHCNYSINGATDFSKLVAVWDCGGEPMNRASMIRWENPLIGTVNHVQKKVSNFGNILASSTGTGAQSIEKLSKDSVKLYAVYLQALNKASAIAKSKGYTVKCPALFWVQGEDNYNAKTTDEIATKLDYKAKLVKLKNDMQADAMRIYGQTNKPLFYTYQTGLKYTQGKTVRIGMAQLEASLENEDIIAIGPVYPYTNRSWHLDPNGYRWFGEMMGKVYYKTQILGEKFLPVQPMTIYRTDNPNIIKIKFHVPVPPLVFDTKLVEEVGSWATGYTKGFEIFADGVAKSLLNVTIEEGNTVVLETYRADKLTGKTLEIRYAGQPGMGRGNLRDSDTYPAFYTYIDLDAKNTDGSYVYPRVEGETTLRPDFEPKDNITGLPIYGQTYPLYNWSMAFYYKLNADQNVLSIISDPSGVKSNVRSKISIIASDDFISIKNFDGITVKDISVFDFQGKKVKQFDANTNNQYPIKSFQKGFYIVRVTASDGASYLKFRK